MVVAVKIKSKCVCVVVVVVVFCFAFSRPVDFTFYLHIKMEKVKGAAISCLPKWMQHLLFFNRERDACGAYKEFLQRLHETHGDTSSLTALLK